MPLSVWGAGSPSNTMWPGPTPTSIPSGILVHPAVWLKHSGGKLGGGLCPFSGGVAGSPSNTMSRRPRPTSVPSGILIHAAELDTGFPTSHPPRFYTARNFLKMGIKMPTCVVFWTTSTIKDEKSAAKFHYIKTVSRKVVAQSIAFRVVSIYWQGTTPSSEILAPSDLPPPEGEF